MSTCAIGLDIGTTSIKIVLIQEQSLAHSSASSTAPSPSSSPRQYYSHTLPHHAYPSSRTSSSLLAEQDVDRIIHTVDLLLNGLSAALSASGDEQQVLLAPYIRHIGITDQMHGVVRWNSQNPVSEVWTNACTRAISAASVQAPSSSSSSAVTSSSSSTTSHSDHSSLITWEDRRSLRSTASSDYLTYCNTILRESECENATPNLKDGYGMTSLALIEWEKKQQQRQQQQSSSFSSQHQQQQSYSHCGTIGDYLTFLLSFHNKLSMKLSTIDHTDAAAFGGFDTNKGKWDTQLIQKLNVNVMMLPSVVPSSMIIGELDPYFKQRFPLLAQANVHTAIGDHPASVYAAQLEEGQLLLTMGTSSQIARIVKKVNAPEKNQQHIEVRPYVTSDSVLLLAASLNGGNVLAKFVSGISTAAGGETTDSDIWTRLIRDGMKLIEGKDEDTALNEFDTTRYFTHERDDSATTSAASSSSLSTPAVASSNSVPSNHATQARMFNIVCCAVIRNLWKMSGGDTSSTTSSSSSFASSPLLTNITSIQLLGSPFARNPVLQYYVGRIFGVEKEKVGVPSAISKEATTTTTTVASSSSTSTLSPRAPTLDAAYGAALLSLRSSYTPMPRHLNLGRRIRGEGAEEQKAVPATVDQQSMI